MTLVLRTLICFILLMFPIEGWAQTLGGGAILQGGPWAQGHGPMYVGQGSSQAIVMDSGPASGGGVGVGLSEQLLVARGTGTAPFIAQGSGPFGTNWCDYDAPTTNPTGYHFLCLSANVNGNSYIATGPGGTGTPGGLTFNINGIETTYTGKMPLVTSVGADFNTGLITVTNTPITTAGVLHFNVAGNTGGIPYFNSPTSWASTPTLTAGLPLVGGGAGAAPFSASKTGNTNIFGTSTGSLVNGDCVSIDGNGNFIDAGGPCTTGGGGGTVAPSTANNLAYYAVTGTTVTGLPTANDSVVVTDPTGIPSLSQIIPSAVQDNITRLGTIVSGVWNGSVIPAIYGGTGLATYTSGGLLYSPTTTSVASSAALSSGLPVIGQGAGLAPTTGTKSGPGTKFATTTGALTTGNCVSLNGTSDFVDSGGPCGSGGIASGTDGGTANARVITASYSLAVNSVVSFLATSTNTGPTTANVNGTGLKNIFVPLPSGPVALAGGEIKQGNIILLSYDGTRYQLLNPPSSSGMEMASGLLGHVTGSNKKMSYDASYIQMASSNGSIFRATNPSPDADLTLSGAGGLDTGSASPNTFYHVWAISNGTTTTGLLSLSSTAPIMPAGYIYKARIGANRTDASTNFPDLQQVGARSQYITYPTFSSSLVTSCMPNTASVVTVQAFSGGSTNSSTAINPIGFTQQSVRAWTSSGNGSNSIVIGDLNLTSSRTLTITVSGTGHASCVGWVDSIIAF